MAQTPLSHSGYEELTCHCGAEVIYPPIPCGTRPPPCYLPCARMHACQHPGLQTSYSFTSYFTPPPHSILAPLTSTLCLPHISSPLHHNPSSLSTKTPFPLSQPCSFHRHTPPPALPTSCFILLPSDSHCHAPPPCSPYFMFHPPP